MNNKYLNWKSLNRKSGSTNNRTYVIKNGILQDGFEYLFELEYTVYEDGHLHVVADPEWDNGGHITINLNDVTDFNSLNFNVRSSLSDVWQDIGFSIGGKYSIWPAEIIRNYLPPYFEEFSMDISSYNEIGAITFAVETYPAYIDIANVWME